MKITFLYRIIIALPRSKSTPVQADRSSKKKNKEQTTKNLKEENNRVQGQKQMETHRIDTVRMNGSLTRQITT
jgi:hypothetical protein